MHDIELVTIGDEVLKGHTLNTNASWISQTLLDQGWKVHRHTTIADHPEEIAQVLQEALKRSRVIITTGGLGPTCDDLTRQTVAKVCNRPLQHDATIAQELHQRFGKNKVDESQTLVFEGADPIYNPIGTAYGAIIACKDATLILLPGVPGEMKAMFTAVLSHLETLLPTTGRFQVRQLHLVGLLEMAIDPILRDLKQEFPKLEVGIYPSQGTLTLRFMTQSPDSQAILTSCCERIRKNFSSHCFEASSGTLEEALHHAFLNSKKTLALAESCTGGAALARLVSIPGASAYLVGGVVTYSNALKEKILGVHPATLEHQGAVSQETALEMLSGILRTSQADFGGAITGIAGPDGGSCDKPVGTVWIAVGARGKPPHARLIRASGDRKNVISYSTNALFSDLLKIVDLF